MFFCNTGERNVRNICCFKQLLNQKQELICSGSSPPITSFCFNWVDERKYGQSSLSEAGELEKQPHSVSDGEHRYAPEVTNLSILIQFIQKPFAKPRLARLHLFTLSPSTPDLEVTLKFIGKMRVRRRRGGKKFYD